MDRKLKGAVVGYGFISGNGHLPAYLGRPDVEIRAIADLCEARRQIAKERVPGARIYASAEELLEREAGDLDFIDISTPPCDHARIARLAFKRGLHVLCEKPLATTVEDARDLLYEARFARRVLFPCHNYKHAPVVKAVREVLHSGRIGRVRSITLSTFRNTHAKGVPEWRTHWRRDLRTSGGGIAMDHGSHSFYLAFEWMGEYPTAVTAKLMNRAADNLELPEFPMFKDTEDNFSAVLTFPSGLAHAHLTWTAGVRKAIYTIQGEKGAIRVEDDDLEVAIMRTTEGPDVAQGAVTWDVERRSIASHWMDASHVTWFNSLFDEFRKAIETQDFTGKDAFEAFLCVQLITQAYRSAQYHSVEMPLVFGPLNALKTRQEEGDAALHPSSLPLFPQGA